MLGGGGCWLVHLWSRLSWAAFRRLLLLLCDKRPTAVHVMRLARAYRLMAIGTGMFSWCFSWCSI